MSFLSREPMVANKVTNFYLLTWATIYAVLVLGIVPLTGLPKGLANYGAMLISWSVIFVLRWRFGARLRDWLDGGY